jgi:hypothetical protein
LTDKLTNFKINGSGVAGIKYLQARKYSNTPGLRGGGSRYINHKKTIISRLSSKVNKA